MLYVVGKYTWTDLLKIQTNDMITMDGWGTQCLEDVAQHRGDDALATQLTNSQATYRMNSTLLLV